MSEVFTLHSSPFIPPSPQLTIHDHCWRAAGFTTPAATPGRAHSRMKVVSDGDGDGDVDGDRDGDGMGMGLGMGMVMGMWMGTGMWMGMGMGMG